METAGRGRIAGRVRTDERLDSSLGAMVRLFIALARGPAKNIRGLGNSEGGFAPLPNPSPGIVAPAKPALEPAHLERAFHRHAPGVMIRKFATLGWGRAGVALPGTVASARCRSRRPPSRGPLCAGAGGCDSACSGEGNPSPAPSIRRRTSGTAD